MLKFDDDNFFEYKIVFSLLAQKEIQMKFNTNEFYESFLSLIQKITYNTKIDSTKISNTKINNTKTLHFVPGAIIGGKVTHDTEKINITQFLAPLLVLAPFTKTTLQLTLKGVTNNEQLSIDTFKYVYTKILNDFGIENVDCKITKRGFAPLGGGEVYFSCNNVANLQAVDFKYNTIKKIRGLAVSSKINASTTNTVISHIRNMLSDLTNNIKMSCDIVNKKESGASPGYQCVLFGTGNQNGYKSVFYGESIGDGRMIENVTDDAILDFLVSVDKSCTYDYRCNKIVFALMCLNLNDVSKINLVELSDEDCKFLNLLQQFFDFSYNLQEENKKIEFVGFGVGYRNIFRTIQ